jgi:hypothetical protein
MASLIETFKVTKSASRSSLKANQEFRLVSMVFLNQTWTGSDCLLKWSKLTVMMRQARRQAVLQREMMINHPLKTMKIRVSPKRPKIARIRKVVKEVAKKTTLGKNHLLLKMLREPRTIPTTGNSYQELSISRKTL